MVRMHYTIKCSCGANVSDSNSSGDSDRYMPEFNCSHFRCSRYYSSKLGWLFGSNAWVSVAFEIHCKKCPSSKSFEHTYWGYSTGDTIHHNKECHDYTLRVDSYES
jgi:hypothetical protein